MQLETGESHESWDSTDQVPSHVDVFDRDLFVIAAQRFFASIVPRQRGAPQWQGKRRFAAGLCRSGSTKA